MLEFTTQAVAEEVGRDAWHQHLTSMCGAISADFHPHRFEGTIEIRSVGGLDFRRHAHNAKAVGRSQAQISVAETRSAIVVFQESGSSCLLHAGEEIPLSRGELMVVDSARPYTWRFDGPASQLSIHVPMSSLAPRLGSATVLRTACRVPGEHGIGAVTRSIVESLFREAGGSDGNGALQRRQAAWGRDALIDLLVATFAEEPSAKAASHDPSAAMRQRVCDYIALHLSDDDLSPSRIAAVHHISVRQLHRLFARSGGSVGARVRELRLERCRQDLLDQRWHGTSVTDIAFRWGFNDMAHFSHAFKSTYGVSAGSLRP